MENEFKELHRAALAIAIKLLGGADDAIRAQIETAVYGGARLVMELDSLPDPQTVRIVLVEREGRRQAAFSLVADYGVPK